MNIFVYIFAYCVCIMRPFVTRSHITLLLNLMVHILIRLLRDVVQ